MPVTFQWLEYSSQKAAVMESYLVSLLLMVFMMADVITVPMCFNGDVCLLAVCLHHRSEGEITEGEGRMSLQVCLEPNQVVHFSSDTFGGGGLDNLN